MKMLPFGIILLCVYVANCQQVQSAAIGTAISERSLDVRGFEGQRFDVTFDLPHTGYDTIVTKAGRRVLEGQNCATQYFNCKVSKESARETISLSGIFSKNLLFAYIEGTDLLPISIYFFVNHQWTTIDENPFYVPNSLPLYIRAEHNKLTEFNCTLKKYNQEFAIYKGLERKLVYQVNKSGSVIVDKREEFKDQIAEIQWFDDNRNKVTFAVKVKEKGGKAENYYYACSSGSSWLFFDIDYTATDINRPVYPRLNSNRNLVLPSSLQYSLDVRAPTGSKFYSSFPLPGKYTSIRTFNHSYEIGEGPVEGDLFEATITNGKNAVAEVTGIMSKDQPFIYLLGPDVIPMTMYFSANFQWPAWRGVDFLRDVSAPIVIGAKGFEEVRVYWSLYSDKMPHFTITGRRTNELIYKYDGSHTNNREHFPEIEFFYYSNSRSQTKFTIYFDVTPHEAVDYYCLQTGDKYLTHVIDWNLDDKAESALPQLHQRRFYSRPRFVAFDDAPKPGDPPIYPKEFGEMGY